MARIGERHVRIVIRAWPWRSDLMMKLAEESIVTVAAPPTTVIQPARRPGCRHEHDELVAELDTLDLQSSFTPGHRQASLPCDADQAGVALDKNSVEPCQASARNTAQPTTP